MIGDEPKKIWLKIDGKIVADGRIEIYTFGNLLVNLQKIINIISRYRWVRRKKDEFKLFLTQISKGSVLAEFQPQYYYSYDMEKVAPLNIVIDEFSELVTTLIRDPEEFKRSIEEKIPLPNRRVQFLQNLKNIWSKEKYHVYTAADTKEPKNFIYLDPSREEYIERLIKEYKGEDQVSLKGVIIRIKGDDPRHFVVETTTGEKVKCYYHPDLESHVKKFYKTPVIVEGFLRKGAKTAEIKELSKIEPFTMYLTDKIGRFELKTSAVFNVSYDAQEGLWCIESEELALGGYGSSYQEALLDLELSLESLIIGFLSIPDEKLNDKSKEIKSRLLKYLDLEQFRNSYDLVLKT